MSMIKCDECGNLVSSKAEKCPHCGANVSGGTPWGMVIFVVVSIALIGICSSFDNDTPTTTKKSPAQAKPKQTTSEPAKPSLTPEEKKTLTEYFQKQIDSGFIKKYDSTSHEVWVDPLVWNFANIEVKEHFTTMAGLYFSFNGKYSHEFVDVFDYQSGKKLAKIGMLGFKAY